MAQVFDSYDVAEMSGMPGTFERESYCTQLLVRCSSSSTPRGSLIITGASFVSNALNMWTFPCLWLKAETAHHAMFLSPMPMMPFLPS